VCLFSAMASDQLKAAPPKPKDGPLGMKFVTLPKGTTYLGWNGQQGSSKATEIKEDFEIAIHTVTQEQWKLIMGKNPSLFSRDKIFKENFLKEGDELKKLFKDDLKEVLKEIKDEDLKQFPVEGVSWNDCQEFVKKLNEKEKAKGYVYRLPTEAEWEYACRGGATTEEECSFHFYVAIPTNDLSVKEANIAGEWTFGFGGAQKWMQRTSKVGSYSSNKLGIYDMHGNVLQWCSDLFNPKENSASSRVARGGCWLAGRDLCRAASRHDGGQIISLQIDPFLCGLRLVRVPSMPAGK
jgi:formylglycine-generating enzyme required for sulfatase activity